LPASGKSFLANRVCDKTGSLLLDSDYAKRKLPEYWTRRNGASLVHKESQVIVMGDPADKHASSVFTYGLSQNFNMVYPCIGNKLLEIVDLSERIKKFGYKSHLILVELDRLKATRRAYNRYKDTRRYIPLSKIYEDYANDSVITYFRAQQKYGHLFESFGQVDTDVDFNQKYKVVERLRDSPITAYRQSSH
jgi:Zeta toxin.